MRAQAANERLSVGGRPNQCKTRQKMMEVGDSRDRNASIECCSPPALVRNGLEPRRAWNRIDPAGDIESISRDFDLAQGKPTANSPRSRIPLRARHADC